MPAGYPIADDLITNSAQKALSARQGKRLAEMVRDAAPTDYIAWAKAVRIRLDNLMRVQWTPVASTFPKYDANGSANAQTNYVSGTTYQGIPYSSTREVDKYVGLNLSLRSFLTAVHNPYSLLYTENLNAASTRSAYGKTYHADQCGPYMGIQCTAFACYVLGLPFYFWTRSFDYAANAGYFTRLTSKDAADVRLYDVIYQTGHVRIISDITYTNGDISKIYVSESVSPLTKTTEYTPSQFNSTFGTSTYSMFRVAMNGLSTEYENVSDIEYNDDICTIGGDYYCFRVGDIIGINYWLGNYTKMEIYRNDHLVLTKDNLSSSDHLVNLTNDNLTQGVYTARLSNADGTVVSKPTHFEVIDALCGCTIQQDGKAKVTFSSKRGAPIYVEFHIADGYLVCQRELTDEERIKGVAIVDAETLLAEQPNTHGFVLEDSYVKVLFRGDYGMVPSEPILSGY